MASRLTENGLYSGLRKSWHIHFCKNRTCRQTYECTGLVDKKTVCEARVNGRCHTCRGAAVRPWWCAARDPHPCCVDNVRQAHDREELLRYRLAGPGPWYLCKSCMRPSGWPLGHNPDHPPTEKEHP